MARVTEEKIILNVLKHLNEKGLPWNNSKFVIINDEVSVLGDGGFAQVVLMDDINDPEMHYAVKILGLKADKRIHQNDYENYKREAILQYRLASECDTIVNILDKAIVSVKLNDAGEVEESILDGSGADKFGWLAFVFIKMEKLEKIIEDTVTGDRLFCLPEVQNIDDKTSLEFAIDIAEALYTSHKKNVMHRDVKLENVFYDVTTGKFKLGDFGIARITNHGSASTKGAGTLGYEAPEVTEECGGKDKYTNKADIYSYGATLYVLLNNLRFPGSSTYNVERSVQYNPKGKIDKPEKGLPELQALACKCLQYYPENRPESMEKILYELYMILEKYYGESKAQEETVVEDMEAVTIKQPENNDTFLEASDNKEQVKVAETNIAKEQKIENTDRLSYVVSEKKESPEVSPKSDDTVVKVDNRKAKVVSNNNNSPIGSVVAEVQKTKEEPKETETKSADEQKKVATVSNQTKPYKLFVGFGVMLIGLLLFELITVKTEGVTYGMFSWILSGVALVFSGISFVRKQKNSKKLHYFLYFLIMCFAVFVMFTEGNVWPIVLLAVGFLIGGASESFVLSIGITLYPVLSILKNTGLVDWICNEKIMFVFLFAILLGFFLLEQYDKQEELISMLFSETPFMLIWSILFIIVGVILGILKLLTVIDAASLLVNLHLLYVGLALFVVGIIQMGKEGYGS